MTQIPFYAGHDGSNQLIKRRWLQLRWQFILDMENPCCWLMLSYFSFLIEQRLFSIDFRLKVITSG